MLRSWVFIFQLSLGLTFTAKAIVKPTVPKADRPTIYFDLGNVIIDTTNEKQFRYVDGAETYLRSLDHRGFRLGLITNIPEGWGQTQAEKIRALKAYIAKFWVERWPFPWDKFDRILVPPADKYRKPHPYLFQLAMQYPDRCQPVFQGEDPLEVEAAAKERMATYLVPEKATPTYPKFASINKLFCRPRHDRFAPGVRYGN